MKKIQESIKKRKSIRNFTNSALSNTDKSIIEDILVQKTVTPFTNQFMFTLIDKMNFEKSKIKLGTYGFITNARYFIIGSSIKSTNATIDYGYALEKVVLDLEKNNIGTCWLGGSFSRKYFGETIKKEPDEIIPAIIVLGKKPSKISIKSKIMRKVISADKRKKHEELFFTSNFHTPFDISSNTVLAEALEMIRLAPSSENHQPWRILINKNKVHFYLKNNKLISKFAKVVNLQYIDIGIAMSHFELTQKSNNIEGEWKTEEEIKDFEKFTYITSWVYK